MIFIITVFIFIVAFCLFLLALNTLYKDKIRINNRLNRIKGKKNSNDEVDELSVPFYQRVIKPMGEKLYNIISKTTPKGMRKRAELKLILAGNPYNLGVNQWFLIKAMLGVALPITVVVFLYLRNIVFTTTGGMLVGIAVMLNIFPSLFLNQYIRKRQTEIVKSLPDVLDLLTVSVEAGLSFDGALSKLVEKMPGVMAIEFGKVLNSMRMGKTRSESLRDMSNRCDVPDLTTLVGGIIQADQLGVRIGNVLRIQSEQMREKRRQRAQEKAMKAPIKILFPLIFFIFPSIFAVLLGPAVIKFLDMFGG